MILFRPEHVDAILAGRKTQTRRLGKRRWNVGSTHQLATRLFDPAAVFARAVIRDVGWEVLAGISREDADAEGYDSPHAFLQAFQRINPRASLSDGVWVVRFEVAA